MKKLFFMLCMVVGFAMTSHAQATFYSDVDVIDVLKMENESLNVIDADIFAPVAVSAQEQAEVIEREARLTAVSTMLTLVPVMGNNATTVDRVFDEPFFGHQAVSQDLVDLTRLYLLNLVTK